MYFLIKKLYLTFCFLQVPVQLHTDSRHTQHFNIASLLPSPQAHVTPILPLILEVVMVAAGVFVLLPVLPVAARRQRHDVLPIVDVV